MRQLIARHIGLPLNDIMKKTNIKKYLKFYSQTLNWDRKQLEEYQNKKLKILIEHAYNNVPFYKKRFDTNNLTPDSINSAEDLVKIPPLTREDIRKNLDDLTARNISLSDCHRSSSSGTTGEPIIYYQDSNALSAGIASIYLGWGWSGWKLGMRKFHIWGNPASVKKWNTVGSKIKRILYNQKNIDSTQFNHLKNYPRIIYLLKKQKPATIEGYTNSIYSLAEYMKKNNIRLDSVKYVFTTAENLTEHQREIIEEILAPVADFYGCGEINGIGTQIAGEKEYFIMEPYVIVEGEPSEDMEYKEIMVTDLENMVMPLIRYKNGDLIDNIYPGDPKAKIRFRYFTKILGRTADVIDLGNGTKILPVNLVGGTVFRKFKNITRHKVVWNGQLMKFVFEVEGDIDKNSLEKEIKNLVQEYNLNYEIEIVKQLLPGKSGKYNYVEIKV